MQFKNTFSGIIPTSWTAPLICEHSKYHPFLLPRAIPAQWDVACLGFIHRSPVQGIPELPNQILRDAFATNITNRGLTLAFPDTHETPYGSLLYLLRHLTLTPPNFLSYCCLPKCHCFCCITMGTVAVPSVPILPLPITFSLPKLAAKTLYVLKFKI